MSAPTHPTSSCTATRPTRSWTASRCPQELAQRAGELGHTALALTDHNSVSGSMELAQAAAEHGVQGDPRRRDRPDRSSPTGPDGCGGGASPPHHAAGRATSRAGATSAGSSRRPCPHPRRARTPRAQGAVGGRAVGARPRAGLVCLTGCAERSLLGAGRAGRRAVDSAAGGVRSREPLRRAAAALCPPRPRPQPCLRRARPPAGGQVRGDRRTSMPTRSTGPSCRTPSWRCATAPRSMPPSRCGAATTAM